MIDGLLASFDSDIEAPVNVGNPDERSITELAELVIDVAGSDSGLTHEPLPPQNPQVRRPDISTARAELGWSPTVNLRDSLERSG